MTVTPLDIARRRAAAVQPRASDGTFGEHIRSAPEAMLAGRIPRCSARDVDVWLGEASRFTIDGIMHSARGGNDRFMAMQFGATPDQLGQMKSLCARNRMQGIMVWDMHRGRRGASYAADEPLNVAAFYNGKVMKMQVTPARLVELTHAWFKSGRDEPLITPETAGDTPTTQANYARMRPFSNRYRDARTNPGGMRDYASWWREPEQSEKGLGFMDGDAIVVTEQGFDLLELKGGHAPLDERMKRGQEMTMEAWSTLDGCRAFVIDENGSNSSTSVIEYADGESWSYDTSLDDLYSTLVADDSSQPRIEASAA